jgi:hypothetical protein
MKLPLEVCDLRARRGAAAIAQVELAAISEQFPSISARSIVNADRGRALRAVRKTRHAAKAQLERRSAVERPEQPDVKIDG